MNAVWVIPREMSAWAQYLQGRRAAHIVEEPNTGDEWVPIAGRMSTRYLGENGPKYLEPTLDKPRWLFRLDPVKVQTWQGVDWAAQYK